mgnify:CR=1 FL=1
MIKINPRFVLILYVLVVLFLIACLLAMLLTGGMDFTTSQPLTSPTSQVREDNAASASHIQIFDELWKFVRDNYVYEDYNGVDWDAIGRTYRARVEAGLSDEAFWRLMDDMVQELGDDHSYFLSPHAVARQERMRVGRLNYVGVGFTASPVVEEQYAVILQVMPGSPADSAGLRPHDRILAIDGHPACCDAQGRDNLRRLSGERGSTVELRVQSPGEAARTERVTRAFIAGSMPVEKRRLEGDIGYLLIPNLWDELTVRRMREALKEMSADGELRGLVVDMRLNRGGSSTVLQGALACFVDGELGHIVTRRKEYALHVPGVDVGGSQDVPLVILVGRQTRSFAEVFSGALQEAGRARVVGRTTEGNVEVLYGYSFNDGSQAWIAYATFRPPSGADWEETGIIPDVEIPLDWHEFTTEDDPQLAAAVELLTSESEEAMFTLHGSMSGRRYQTPVGRIGRRPRAPGRFPAFPDRLWRPAA